MSNQEMSVEEMQAAVKADKASREKRARERIQAVLQEERCAMNPMAIITAQGTKVALEINALD